MGNVQAQGIMGRGNTGLRREGGKDFCRYNHSGTSALGIAQLAVKRVYHSSPDKFAVF